MLPSDGYSGSRPGSCPPARRRSKNPHMSGPALFCRCPLPGTAHAFCLSPGPVPGASFLGRWPRCSPATVSFPHVARDTADLPRLPGASGTGSSFSCWLPKPPVDSWMAFAAQSPLQAPRGSLPAPSIHGASADHQAPPLLHSRGSQRLLLRL